MLLKNRGGALPNLVPAGYVTGADRIEDCRGIGVTDIDRDGDLDLIVQCVEKPAVLLVNQGTVGHSLQVQLQGTRSNRDAIGARVEVRIGKRQLFREVGTSHGFISGKSKTSHFGIGDATRIDEVTVYWPSGQVSRSFGVAADQILRLVEPR